MIRVVKGKFRTYSGKIVERSMLQRLGDIAVVKKNINVTMEAITDALCNEDKNLGIGDFIVSWLSYETKETML